MNKRWKLRSKSACDEAIHGCRWTDDCLHVGMYLLLLQKWHCPERNLHWISGATATPSSTFSSLQHQGFVFQQP